MSATQLLLDIAGGVFAEVVLFVLLRRWARQQAKGAAAIVAMAVALVYLPWAALHWPGGDVFAIHLAIYLTAAYILGVIGGRQGGVWHWAPMLIIAFFGVVIATNVVFLGVAERGITGIFNELLPAPQGGRVADSRFPGTVAYDFQEKEHLYNAYLDQVEEQRARGWQVKKGWRERPVVGEPAEFLVKVSDADGRALDDVEVSGEFLRTSNSADDFDFRMVARGGGFYSLETRMPLPGLWRLLLFVRQGEAVHEIQATTSVAAHPD